MVRALQVAVREPRQVCARARHISRGWTKHAVTINSYPSDDPIQGEDDSQTYALHYRGNAIAEYRWARPNTQSDPRWAPTHVFDEILKYSVIPTIDLVLQCGPGIVLVRRVIPPYARKWALPGLRLLKGDGIDDCIERIAREELGIRSSDLSEPFFVGQGCVKFRTEMERQDLASSYYVKTTSRSFVLNADHYSSVRLIGSIEEVPSGTGTLYRTELGKWFRTDTTR